MTLLIQIFQEGNKSSLKKPGILISTKGNMKLFSYWKKYYMVKTNMYDTDMKSQRLIFRSWFCDEKCVYLLVKV